jgi:hypothetical protein
MGIKWSIYLANLYQFLFDELRKNMAEENENIAIYYR